MDAQTNGVKRYEHDWREQGLFLRADGDWVQYSDHLAEMQKKDAEIEEWKTCYRLSEEANDEKIKTIDEKDAEIARLLNIATGAQDRKLDNIHKHYEETIAALELKIRKLLNERPDIFVTRDLATAKETIAMLTEGRDKLFQATQDYIAKMTDQAKEIVELKDTISDLERCYSLSCADVFDKEAELAAQSEIIGKVKYAHALLLQCWNAISAEERAYYGNPLTTEHFKNIRELHSEVAALEALLTKQPEPKEGV